MLLESMCMHGKHQKEWLVVVIPSAEPCRPCHDALTLPQHLPPAPRETPCRGGENIGRNRHLTWRDRGGPSAHRPQTSAGRKKPCPSVQGHAAADGVDPHRKDFGIHCDLAAHLKQFLCLLLPGASRLLFRQPSQNRKPCAAGNIIVSCSTPRQHVPNDEWTFGPAPYQ